MSGPQDVTLCSGNTADIFCGYTGVDPNFVVPSWRIMRKDYNSNVISDEYISASSINSDSNDRLHWLPDLTSGDNNATNSRLVVGPVDETYDKSTYQCVFALANSTNIESTTATLTVIGIT